MAQAHGQEANESNQRRVMIALVLTGTFMLVEVVGGIISGSLALLADAGHMLTDTMALSLAAMAFQVSKRPPGGHLTYGYQRFQILAAFVNGLSLLAVVGWILFEAVSRFFNPRDVLGETMLVVATAGLVINLVSFAVLHTGDKENLNIRGAALHVAGDLLGSIAAIVAAIIIINTGWTPIDPILSVARNSSRPYLGANASAADADHARVAGRAGRESVRRYSRCKNVPAGGIRYRALDDRGRGRWLCRSLGCADH